MDLPEDVLRRSPEEAARRIALGFLADARAAITRLDDAADPEALHDFRVAVRRLRSTLRAWRPQLKRSVSKRHRRGLRALQRKTGSARDAEASLAWLATQRAELAPEQQRGVDWLAARLRRRRERNLSPARAEVERGFERIHARLRRSLARMTVTTRLLPDGRRAERSFAESLAGKARDDAKRLSRRLAAVTSADDRRACHRARIACKRLRYLLEPIRRELPEAREAVRRCRGLQDVLGELNDAHVLREELETAIGAAKSAGARAGRGPGDAELPGLVELTRRVDARVGELFGILEGEWLGDGARALLRGVEELAEGLERSARAGVEIERKYLLSALPVIPPHAEVLEVDQGWLPGERLRERVRRQRGDAGTTYWRTLKFGKGLERAEIEERTTAEVFEPLWSLTKDCRIRKRRYKVREGELVFEIDEFLDRELFLAEVELASASLEPALPGWLAERVVREVTEDPRYSNFELAQGGERAPAER